MISKWFKRFVCREVIANEGYGHFILKKAMVLFLVHKIFYKIQSSFKPLKK